ncbi:hypothetical protein BDN72DRAFT_864904 [Pluteus cervinus]|uniref:Uncharacterized protein n=1 Tax=Pluteus cervinus TaxID=181527 RepID=A0ACD3A271_9AGAR|nr:hypothetical protein BDN72DRAFT_864904 [Pluteus cervinus]
MYQEQMRYFLEGLIGRQHRTSGDQTLLNHDRTPTVVWGCQEGCRSLGLRVVSDASSTVYVSHQSQMEDGACQFVSSSERSERQIVIVAHHIIEVSYVGLKESTSDICFGRPKKAKLARLKSIREGRQRNSMDQNRRVGEVASKQKVPPENSFRLLQLNFSPHRDGPSLSLIPPHNSASLNTELLRNLVHEAHHWDLCLPPGLHKIIHDTIINTQSYLKTVRTSGGSKSNTSKFPSITQTSPIVITIFKEAIRFSLVSAYNWSRTQTSKNSIATQRIIYDLGLSSGAAYVRGSIGVSRLPQALSDPDRILDAGVERYSTIGEVGD